MKIRRAEWTTSSDARGGASDERKKAAAAIVVPPASFEAEEVAELARLLRRARLRVECFLDFLSITHIMMITKVCTAVASNTNQADVQGV